MSTTHQTIERKRTPHGEIEHREEHVAVDPVDQTTTVAQRIVNYIGTLLIGLLAIRFILALFGANAANGFVSAIYNITAPFVAPFNTMFGADTQLGTARFEIETLIAILVIGILTVLISNFVGLFSRRGTEVT
jgi:YggT family protein